MGLVSCGRIVVWLGKVRFYSENLIWGMTEVLDFIDSV